MRAYLLIVLMVMAAACHRKNVPEKPNTTATESGTANKPAEESASVVVTGDGKVVNSSNSSDNKVYSVTKARSFTPNQKKNLMLRYKTVPPRVLNVPESLAQKNAKGSYYVYKNKFWYWQANDGYYYLDPNYYN